MSEFKDILIYLDDEKLDINYLRMPLALAKISDATVTAVTLSTMKPSYLKYSDPKVLSEKCLEEAENRIKEFTEFAKSEGLKANSRIIHRQKSRSAERLSQVARNFDLVILRQPRPKNPNHKMREEIAHQVILLSGRPVFFMPYIGAHRTPCKNAMIAWDGSPTASRAVHDSLPLLKTLEEVYILVIQEGIKKTAKGELLADDLCSHLRNHGVNASVKRTRSGTFDVQTVILNEIADNDIDLLVMGGYGTPSIKQKIFGGVTQTLLANMTIPLLMSH